MKCPEFRATTNSIQIQDVLFLKLSRYQLKILLEDRFYWFVEYILKRNFMVAVVKF